MFRRGFVDHALMGAIFLGGAWLAFFLPRILSAMRLGGWKAVLAGSFGLIGGLVNPLIMVRCGGDELFGLLGVVTALIGAWGSVRVAVLVDCPLEFLDSIRLGSAAIAPGALYLAIRMVATYLDQRESRQM